MGNDVTPEEAWNRLLDAMPPWARRLASMAGDAESWDDFSKKVVGEPKPFWQGADPQEFFRKVVEGAGGEWGRSTVRAGKGDVRSAILALLSEEPMHGYQLMQQMSQRSDGAWRPSPGSVYPTLSQMEEEGLIEAEATGGRKVYSLTAEGRIAAAAEDGAKPPWESVNERAQDSTGEDEASAAPTTAGSDEGSPPSVPHQASQMSTAPHAEALQELSSAVHSVLRTGDDAQSQSAMDVLIQARKSIYKILAEG